MHLQQKGNAEQQRKCNIDFTINQLVTFSNGISGVQIRTWRSWQASQG